jgi:hypothetical protein
VRALNSRALGLGAFHVGVVVHGREWSLAPRAIPTPELFSGPKK